MRESRVSLVLLTVYLAFSIPVGSVGITGRNNTTTRTYTDFSDWLSNQLSITFADGIGLIADLIGLHDYFSKKATGEDEMVKETLEDISSGLDKVEKGLKTSMEQIKEAMEENGELQLTSSQFESMRTRFFVSEQGIRNSYEHWRAYLSTKTEEAKVDFIAQSSDLIKSINTLLDGLLGKSIFGSDLLTITQMAHKYHPRKFRADAENYLGLVRIGGTILAAYYHHSQTLEVNQNYWKYKLAQKELAAIERIRQMEAECRMETRVATEMSRVLSSMNDRKSTSNQEAADALLAFLVDKYETKSWFVMVYDSAGDDEEDDRRELHSASRNFHRVISRSGKNALAASVGPEDDRWTPEEKSYIEGTINRFCLEQTSPFDADRRIFGSKAVPPLVPRCEYASRTDVVFRQLNRLVTTNKPVKLAVLSVSADPASAIAPLKGVPLDFIYYAFNQTDDDEDDEDDDDCRRLSLLRRHFCSRKHHQQDNNNQESLGVQILVIPSTAKRPPR